MLLVCDTCCQANFSCSHQTCVLLLTLRTPSVAPWWLFLVKLKTSKISEIFTSVLALYLLDREPQLKTHDNIKTVCANGVPQGLVLNPMLCSIWWPPTTSYARWNNAYVPLGWWQKQKQILDYVLAHSQNNKRLLYSNWAIFNYFTEQILPSEEITTRLSVKEAAERFTQVVQGAPAKARRRATSPNNKCKLSKRDQQTEKNELRRIWHR